MTAFQELWSAQVPLLRDPPATVERLRDQFRQRSSNRLQALYILRLVDDEYTIAVISEVVDCYLSEGSRIEALQTLRMLNHTDLEQHVPLAVWHLLEYEPRDDDYDELALASSNPKSRSVGERLRKEFLPQPPETR